MDRCPHQELVFRLADQVLWYDPPEGRPSGTPAVEVVCAATGAREEATTGACSVDAVSTALEAAVCSGMTTLLIADGAGVARGRHYLLSNGEGDREWIEVRAVDGARVTTRRPILSCYPASSPLVGCRISIAVAAAWAADPAKLSDRTDVAEPELPGYRVSWAYVADGVALRGVSTADLVHQAALDLVTPMDVDERFPGWRARLPVEHREDQGAAFIREAFAAVKLDARGDRHAMRRLRDAGVLRELVTLRANLINIEHAALFGSASHHELETAERRYRTRRDKLLREPVAGREPVDMREPVDTREPVAAREPVDTREPVAAREPVDMRGAVARALPAAEVAPIPWPTPPRLSSREIILGRRGPGRRS